MHEMLMDGLLCITRVQKYVYQGYRHIVLMLEDRDTWTSSSGFATTAEQLPL